MLDSYTFSEEATLATWITFLGFLAATPMMWCCMFLQMFSFNILVSWTTHVYRCGFIMVYAFIFLHTFVNHRIHRWTPAVFLICSILLTCGFLVYTLYFPPRAVVHTIIFFLGLFLMSAWPKISFDLVYLCPFMYQRLFELGSLIGMCVQVLVTFDSNFKQSPIYFLPIMLAFALGYHAICVTRQSPIYLKGLERCRTIFQRNGKFIKIELCEVLRMCKTSILVMALSTLSLIITTAILHFRTSIFYGTANAAFLVYIGFFFVSGLYSGTSYAYLLVNAVGMAFSFMMIYAYSDTLHPTLIAMFLFLYIFMYYSILTILFGRIRHILKGCENSSTVILRCLCLCCSSIALTMYILLTYF